MRIFSRSLQPIRCFCLNDSTCHGSDTCEVSREGRCYYHHIWYPRESVTQGCTGGGSLLFNCLHEQYDHGEEVYYCCNDGDLCNIYPSNRTGITITPTTDAPSDSQLSSGIIILIVVFLALLIGIVSLIVYCLNSERLKCRWNWRKLFNNTSSTRMKEIFVTNVDDSRIVGRRLVEKTMADDITMGDEIGRGSFGRVQKAKYRDRDVAVKVFTVFEAFQQERRIYNDIRKTYDEHILQVIGDASHKNASTGRMELWLVLEYCELGSLSRYLDKNVVENVETCIRMCHDIATGLDFLHHEMKMIGDTKLEIAHRDLKPSNILVRRANRGVKCVLCDFGYAVVNNKFGSRHSVENTHRDNAIGEQNISVASTITHHMLVGTVRYMSPEVLSETIPPNDFDKFKCSDVYSLALVIWEIATCTVVIDSNGEKHTPDGHVLPYWHVIARDPSPREMENFVFRMKFRPEIKDYWMKSEQMKTLVTVMQECWRAEPSSRLTASNVKKEVAKMLNECISS